jgi:hypothetical protein
MIVALVYVVTSPHGSHAMTSALFLESIIIVFLTILDILIVTFVGGRVNDELLSHWLVL